MKWILLAAVSVVAATIGSGLICLLKQKVTDQAKLARILKWNAGLVTPLMLTALALLVPDIALAADAGTLTSASGFGFMAAGLSTGLACIGAGYAVGAVGSSALGAVSEDASMLGKTLIFVGLAEGIAIYGLIISIMILQRV